MPSRMKPTLSKHIIVNLFEGKTTPLQKTLIEEWLTEPANQELYFQWLEEWEQENPQFMPDIDKAYARSLRAEPLETLPTADASSDGPVLSLLSRIRFYQWAAACLVLALGLGGYLLRDTLRYKRYETAYGEVRTIQLPDNSRVSLNAHSVLVVPRFGFGSGTREVRLMGEAEFSVKHTPSHQQFVVRTLDQLEVQVLGTEFVVYSRPRGSKVVLSKGKVQLRSLTGGQARSLVMTPGDVVTMSKQGQFTLRHQQPLAVHTAWKEHRLAFENTPISEVADRLAEQFGVKVIVTDSALAHRTIGGTFKAQTADQFLQVMAEILDLKVVKNAQPNQSTQTFVLTPAP